MEKIFNSDDIKKLFVPKPKSSGEDNGQVTIIGGSELFHGAPLFALKIASRIVDMVFFATPESSVGKVAEKIKSKLLNFIWVDWKDTVYYIEKSDAVLIGPGFMRYHTEKNQQKMKNEGFDGGGEVTRKITKFFLKKFPDKRWVIDAGSLQVMDADWIPENSILTPNQKEFEILFKMKVNNENIRKMAEKYHCIIVSKGPESRIYSQNASVIVKDGNAGMTKGGTGDVLSGLTVAFLAKNEPFLAASAASFIEKYAADELYKNVGTNYNADDLADKIPEIIHKFLI